MGEVNSSLKRYWKPGVISVALVTLLVLAGWVVNISKTRTKDPIQQANVQKPHTEKVVAEIPVVPNESLSDKDTVSNLPKKPDVSEVEATRPPKVRVAHPIIRQAPVMPDDAAHSGYCNIQFDVTMTGTTSNIKALSCTENLFEAPAISAVERWTYTPRTVNDQAIVQKNLFSKVTFRLADEEGKLLVAPDQVDEKINSLLDDEDRAELKSKNFEETEVLSTLPTSAYCCMRFSVSQIGSVFNEDAVSCTDFKQVKTATSFVREMLFAPASYGGANISSADYTMLVKFYNVSALPKSAPVEIVPIIGTQTEKDQNCNFG